MTVEDIKKLNEGYIVSYGKGAIGILNEVEEEDPVFMCFKKIHINTTNKDKVDYFEIDGNGYDTLEEAMTAVDEYFETHEEFDD